MQNLNRLFYILILLLIADYLQADLKFSPKQKFRWPKGTERLDVKNSLFVYRDKRTPSQFLLIRNFSDKDVLLQSMRDDQLPEWVLPAKKLTILAVEQNTTELMCIEKFITGESKSSCSNFIESGLLPDTMYQEVDGKWAGNFSSIFELSVELLRIGVTLVV